MTLDTSPNLLSSAGIQKTCISILYGVMVEIIGLNSSVVFLISCLVEGERDIEVKRGRG